jgi:branched-chain amino acid transport system substrate-binding protein
MIADFGLAHKGYRAMLTGWASIAILGLLAACGGNTGGGTGSAAGEPIQIGAVLPLSGAQASLGAAWKAGIELALDRINARGGVLIKGQRHRLDVKVTDDESTPAGASRSVQTLLTDGNKIFLGPCLSSSFATAYGILKGNKDQLVLTPAAASEAMLTGDNVLFKTQATQTGGGIGRFATYLVNKYHPTKVAVLEPQNPTGDLISKGMVQGFQQAGVQVVYNNQFPSSVTDYGPYLSAIRRLNPDMVVGPYVDSYMAPFIDQAVQIGYTQPVFANYGGSKASVARHESDIKDFAWQPVTRAVDNPNDPTVAPFRKAYQAKYGKEPGSIDFYALSLYDPVLMLAGAMEKVGSSTDLLGIAKTLKTLKTWPDQVLPFTFDEKGLAHYTYQVGTLSNGKVTYEDIGTT